MLVGLGVGRDGVGNRAERRCGIDPRGQLRRRRAIVATLFLASAAAAILVVFSPSIGAPLTTFFVLALAVDLVLLARRQQHVAEWAMTAAFRSRATRTAPGIPHSRPGS